MAIDIITTEGQFDARKARQILYELQRDSDILRRSRDLATHLGLSSEETYLLIAVSLLSENHGLHRMLLDEINTRVPTFRVQATQTGPFDLDALSHK